MYFMYLYVPSNWVDGFVHTRTWEVFYIHWGCFSTLPYLAWKKLQSKPSQRLGTPLIIPRVNHGLHLPFASRSVSWSSPCELGDAGSFCRGWIKLGRLIVWNYAVRANKVIYDHVFENLWNPMNLQTFGVTRCTGLAYNPSSEPKSGWRSKLPIRRTCHFHTFANMLRYICIYTVHIYIYHIKLYYIILNYIYTRCQFRFLQMSVKCHETSKYIKLPSEFRVALITARPLRSSPDHVAACCHPSVNTGRRHRSKMTTPSTGCATKWTIMIYYDLLTLSHTVLDFWLCTSCHRILHHSRVNIVNCTT